MLLMAICALAHADAIGPDPTDCSPGSVGTSSHCGSYCVPTSCDPSAPDCGTAQACQPVGICIEKRQQPQSCGDVPEGTPMVEVDVAHGACSSDGDCESGQTCSIAPRCVSSKGGGMCPFMTILPMSFFGIGLLGLIGKR
jgi:hypothetical protein